MNGFGRLGLIVMLVTLVPMSLTAQQENRWTREANKSLAMAMMRQTPAERQPLYAAALVQLEQGMEAEPQNALVWRQAGSAYAGLGRLEEAHNAWTKAVELHAEYREELESEREAAWIEAFNGAMRLMGEQKYAEATALLEGAQLVYDQRPEGLMNLGSLYAAAQDYTKAEAAFRRAIETTKGPLAEKLDSLQQADWARFANLATINIAQMLAGQGVEAFQTNDFVAAEAKFREAAEMNPQARDYWFNIGQALYRQTQDLEEDLDSIPEAQQVERRARLVPMYREIGELMVKVEGFDPNNPGTLLLRAQAARQIGAHEGTAEEGSREALRLLEAARDMPVLIEELYLDLQGEQTVVRGKLVAQEAGKGSAVRLTVTLLGPSGASVGEQATTLTAAAEADAAVEFEITAATAGEVAGWKYTVGGS